MLHQGNRARVRGKWVEGFLLIATMLSLPALAEIRNEGAMPDGRGGVAVLTAGYDHVCGLRSDGTAKCWGANYGGKATPPAGSFVALSAGFEHTCGLRGDGSIACWGIGFADGGFVPEGAFTALASGMSYTCGLRARVDPWDYLSSNVECWTAEGYGPAPVPVPPSGIFVALTAGDEHACGLRADGRAECWGANEQGQATAPAEPFIALSAGARHTCGLHADGTVACWGFNGDGQATPPPEIFTAVSANGFHTCGLLTDGRAHCWGQNLAGQATAPEGMFTALTGSFGHTCGLRTDGRVDCWGRPLPDEILPMPDEVFGAGSVAVGGWHTCQLRPDGQLRCMGIEPSSFPWDRFTSVGNGEGFSCGLLEEGRLQCFGNNADGQQGVPWEPVRHFDLGQAFGCAVMAIDGRTQCWGWNSNGQTQAPAGFFRNVSAGFVHGCGVFEDGIGACWGYNGDGQTSVPQLPEGVSYLAIQAGERHSCGLSSDNFVTCWGLGTRYGYELDHDQVPPTGYFRALSVGAFHNCAIRTDGRLACWGKDWSGQISSPTGTYASVSSGSSHSCAIRDDGMRLCWGGPNPLYMHPESLPAMGPSRPYAAQMSLSATSWGPPGPEPVPTPSFVIAAGELPAGISLSASGELSGTPTAASGSYPVTIEGRDGGGFATQRNFVLAVDDTPPVLTRRLVGPLGDNGWYVGFAEVEWTAYDPESEVTMAGACHGWISGDYEGVDYVCTAQSAGGSVSDSHFIKVDVTKPETTLTATQVDRTDATFVFTGSDAMSGVASYECSLDAATFTACTSPMAYSALSAGTHSFQVRAADAAGHRDATPASHSWQVDATPPIITPVISGTQGSNGWYVGNVAISWSVSDPDSAITSTTGCNPVTLNTDTLGTGFTCTATSAGGTASKTVTIKRDTVAPVIQAAATTVANAAGWYRTAVTVDFSCSDAASGVTACPAAQLLNGEGTLSSSARTITDAAGNSATSNVVDVRIDHTAPTLAPAVTPGTLLLNSTASATANGSDAVSGIVSQSCAALVTVSVGSKTVSCTVTDAAGNAASADASYEVVYGFAGFSPPVQNPPTLNLLKAGRSVPLRWRVVDWHGAPVANLGTAAIATTVIACPGTAENRISVYGGASSQLQNLGNGYYQLDWPASPGYRGTCRSLSLDLGDGQAHPAQFRFN